ncbi:hypothetical protein Hsero_2665 [Herbaspirillum seropedicae SmR1]|uniref:Uncharacterized protein n=1 Tax=Herbaspirillum seropedicae (strain SmR1) TaxID=757424 RepID=D8IXQ9_HERSS|nr:hypothetical protein Hsero_2665 [Herbaspirillum seropedicae SmR1]
MHGRSRSANGASCLLVVLDHLHGRQHPAAVQQRGNACQELARQVQCRQQQVARTRRGRRVGLAQRDAALGAALVELFQYRSQLGRLLRDLLQQLRRVAGVACILFCEVFAAARAACEGVQGELVGECSAIPSGIGMGHGRWLSCLAGRGCRLLVEAASKSRWCKSRSISRGIFGTLAVAEGRYAMLRCFDWTLDYENSRCRSIGWLRFDV